MKMDYKTLFINLAKMIFAGLVTGAACYTFAFYFDKVVTLPKYVFELVKISITAILCLAVYIPLNIAMKMDYAKTLLKRFLDKTHHN